MRSASPSTALPWARGKWRPREERLQLLDVVLKILVPVFLLVCLGVALKYGSFQGYVKDYPHRALVALQTLSLG